MTDRRRTLAVVAFLGLPLCSAAAEPGDAAAPPAVLAPISIEDTQEAPPYVRSDVSTATKMDVPLQDIPASVQTVTHELIQDQAGLARVNDLGRNVSGVFIQEPGEGGSNTASYVFRGFNSGYWQLVDGSRRSAQYMSPDLSEIDRVEFLKGPASVLYGDSGGSYGGVVNFITKKPDRTPLTEIELTGGSYGFYRGTLDVNRALAADGTVLVRVNGAAESGGSFRDGIRHDTQNLAPSIAWSIDADDQLLLQLEYKRTFYVNDYGWPVYPFVLNWPRSLTVGESGFEGNTNEYEGGRLTFDHRFDPGWSLHGLAATGEASAKGCTVYSSINDPVAAPDVVSRTGYCNNGRTKEADLQLDLHGKLVTGSVQHTLLLGVQDTPSENPYSNLPYAPGGYAFPDLNVADPHHGAAGIPLPGTGVEGSSHTVARGAYAQDLMAVTPQIKLLIGGREDNVGAQTYSYGSVTDDRHYTHLSPRAGLVYQPAPTTSLYASYSSSFTPNFGRQRDGSVPAPEIGTQLEIGLKRELLGGAASLSLAAYQLKRRDAAQCDPTDPSCTFVVLIGEQTSRGMEFDLAGRVGAHLRLSAATALMRAVVTADPNIPVGRRLMGAPTRSLSLFGVYTFDQGGGSANGLELGGGAYYASETPGAYLGYTPQFDLPPVERIDAYVAYPLTPDTKLQVNVTNLLDHRNFMSNGFSPWPDQPRTAYATLRIRL